MNVLAVGAHPDDLEILCAGTLAKYAARGDRVTMAVATNGEVGSATLPKAEIAAIRRAEAEASARVIGAQLIWMDYPDEFLFSTAETRLKFLDMVRRAQPDVVLAHAPTDYHPDHRTSGQILWDIRVMTTVPNIRTEAPPCLHIPEILYMETIAGIDFTAEHYVDVSSVFEKKCAMLACHKSQAAWLENQYQMSYLEFIEHIGRYRGLQCGVRYAECFRSSPTWPKKPLGGLLPAHFFFEDQHAHHHHRHQRRQRSECPNHGGAALSERYEERNVPETAQDARDEGEEESECFLFAVEPLQ